MGRTYNWVRTASQAQQGDLQNLRVEVRPAESEQVLASLISLKYIPQDLPGAVTAPPNEDDAS